jgi:PASTA domain-containing protein/dockerin type I repeat protein
MDTSRASTHSFLVSVVALIIGIASLAAAEVTFAQALPGAAASESAVTTGTPSTASDLPGSVTSTGAVPHLIVSANSSASATGGPSPTVSIGASALNSYNCGNGGSGLPCPSAQANLTYFLQVIPPASATSNFVTLNVFTSASVNATATAAQFDTAVAFAEAQLTVTQGQLNTLNTLVNYFAQAFDCAVETSATGGDCGVTGGVGAVNTSTFKPMTTITVFMPQVVKISMEVDGAAIVDGNLEAGGAASASGSLDPFFQVDPSTPNAAGYSLVFSPGIGNSLPVSTIEVPNVVGENQLTATTAIVSTGLTVGTLTSQSSNSVPAGNVISQSPSAGASVADGSAVSLVVSSGPAPLAVPNVVGSRQAAASSAITAAGLTLGTVTSQSSGSVATGVVISESPLAGTSVAAGSPVNLIVSSGPLRGDLNGDGVVNCADLAIIKSSFGKKVGQAGFDPRADVNGDGVVNIIDLSSEARLLPAGTVCN